jgi:uncharacterized membrane protein required for colicin V production
VTPYLIIDAAIVGIIVIFTLRGLKKGLVMAVAGAVIFIVALVGAYFAVGIFAPSVETFVEPMISGWVDNRANERMVLEVDNDGGLTDTVMFDALQRFGLGENQARQISENVSGRFDQAGQSITYAITTAIAYALARILTFAVAFALIMLALYMAAKLLDTIAKLPLLNTINKLGGLAGGVLHGVFIVWLIVYALRFVGVIGGDMFEGSYMLRLFGEFM